MESNEILRGQIFEIIENQIKSNDPIETEVTLKRLINEGFNDFEARQLIGQCLSIEIFKAMKDTESYNESRYIQNMSNLPQEPFEE